MNEKNAAIWCACSIIGQICGAASHDDIKNISDIYSDDFARVKRLAPEWADRIVSIASIRRAELDFMEFHNLKTWQQMEARAR